MKLTRDASSRLRCGDVESVFFRNGDVESETDAVVSWAGWTFKAHAVLWTLSLTQKKLLKQESLGKNLLKNGKTSALDLSTFSAPIKNKFKINSPVWNT